ncbi:MAG TPA: MMPL family transporter, partial [Spirochaetota bacterium]|nr:MMPL family transporter [Spirochaetota bacterium]
DLIVDSQISNIIFSLIAVFLILSVYYRTPIAGIFGMLTLAAPIFLNFGVMGFLGIKLDAGTAMVASVAIGTGIDYTIHFMNAYCYERKLSTDLEAVTTRALQTSGKAIVYNATAVALGFLVLVFSSFMPLVYFGALVGLTMLTASFSAMTLLPVALNIFKPKFISR